MSKEFSIESKLHIKKGLECLNVSGSKKDKESVEKVIEKIKKEYNVSKKEAEKFFVLTLASSGFCEDHMSNFDSNRTTFKKIVLDVTFWDKESFEDFCYEYNF